MTLELFRDDHYIKACEAEVIGGDDLGICLNQTVFYPTGGGQPGDRGWLDLEDGRCVEIVDTTKQADGRVCHKPATPIKLANGTHVQARIDWDRRYRLMRVHTLLHLLCAVVPEAVTGGAIRDDGTGRLDFDIPEPNLDKTKITEQLNRLVAGDHPVSIRWIEDAELQSNPELVRTMSVAPPSGTGRVRLLHIEGVDLQACGGTHVSRTGEIGEVEVKKIEKKGRQNRRINVALI
ncbi:MAG: alanyl-tRNA editing protein [Gammaproteobacteria bacterium]|nr:alanyl-tRNA editing protein [Gammaproteobacteria bacterium]